MKTLIAFASKYGTTEKCANLLKEKLDGDVDVVNLNDSRPSVSDYDAVIIGGPVYMGKLNSKVSSYCVNNLPNLVDKKKGFFICHMDFEKPIDQQLAEFYPKKLIETATAKAGFGGAYFVSKMGFFYKWVIKKAAGVEEDRENIQYDAIDNFASKFNA